MENILALIVILTIIFFICVFVSVLERITAAGVQAQLEEAKEKLALSLKEKPIKKIMGHNVYLAVKNNASLKKITPMLEDIDGAFPIESNFWYVPFDEKSEKKMAEIAIVCNEMGGRVMSIPIVENEENIRKVWELFVEEIDKSHERLGSVRSERKISRKAFEKVFHGQEDISLNSYKELLKKESSHLNERISALNKQISSKFKID